MQGRQGGTHFDCPKLKKKSRKLKDRDAVFLRTGGVLGGTEGTVVFSAARRTQRSVRNCKTNFFVESEYAGTAEATERVHQSTVIIFFIV